MIRLNALDGVMERGGGLAAPRSIFPATMATLGWTLGIFLVLMSARSSTAGDWRVRETAKIRLHAERMACLGSRRVLEFGFDRQASLDRERQEIRRGLVRLQSTHPPPLRKGFLLEAYVSANDDSVQPFWRYLPRNYSPTSSPPLLLYLHGYNPDFDLASAPRVPDAFTNLAERTGACMAAPFARGNTDYQGIGEQDVLRVLDEMVARYGVDRQRVVLVGMSMGGLGAWCIGARWADRFNALLILCGRGDFYVWHDVSPADLPPWQRELVDAQFATKYIDRLLHTPVLASHGRYDYVVDFEQGTYLPLKLKRMGAPNLRFLGFTYADHDVFGLTMMRADTQSFLEEALTRAYPKPEPRTVARPGATGSRIQDALLDPFLFVGGKDGGTGLAVERLQARGEEWRRFAHARPRMTLEETMDLKTAHDCHLFVFGEPEDSPLVCTVLQNAGVIIASDTFNLAGRRLPRQDHGLWLAGVNPFNSNRTAVVQCGLPWGADLPDNHRYDRIPDVIAYGRESDRFGINRAVAAGFIEADGSVRWCDPPFTEAIRRPPTPVYDDFESPFDPDTLQQYRFP